MGIPTGIHTSYVVCLYTMNSLLTWMCTHYTHALHMYLRLVFVYMPRTNIHSIGKRGKGCGQARLVGTCTCALYVWVHTVHWEQSKDKLIDLYINLLWIHVTGISTDIHTSYVSAYTLWILSWHGCVLIIHYNYTCIAHVSSFCLHAEDYQSCLKPSMWASQTLALSSTMPCQIRSGIIRYKRACFNKCCSFHLLQSSLWNYSL